MYASPTCTISLQTLGISVFLRNSNMCIEASYCGFYLYFPIVQSWRRQWHPTQYSCLENPIDGGAWLAAVHRVAKSRTTERLHFHFSFSFSCIGEGNGNPLQCSCLENPRDRGAWWAAIYGVAQSRTRLKRLSSSSSNI